MSDKLTKKELIALHVAQHQTIVDLESARATLASDYKNLDEKYRRKYLECDQAMAECERLRAENVRLAALWNASLDANRPLPFDRETLGRKVREIWLRWAEGQPYRASWRASWDELRETDKEVDRLIGEEIARWTLLGDASSRSTESNKQTKG